MSKWGTSGLARSERQLQAPARAASQALERHNTWLSDPGILDDKLNCGPYLEIRRG
jgi:hypothetical protein